MKAFLGTVSVLGVVLIAFLANQLLDQKSIINELVLLSGLCNTEAKEVKDPEGFARCLKQDGIDQSHYKINIRWKKNGPDPRDTKGGDAPDCTDKWGGGQITQHINLTPNELALFAKCRGGFFGTLTANPSPTPAP